ncbi:MAG: YceK/YidQ family lipoprotein [Candidatus Arsenophonus phytopathogenicus]
MWLFKYYDPCRSPSKLLFRPKADTRILKDSDTGWVIKPLAMIDLPFSALLDTVLLPYDYFQADMILHRNRRPKNVFKIGKTIKLQISLIKPPANKPPE